jgi:hypothetical protein
MSCSLQVLKDFKPKEEGQADYSALVISFCKRWLQSGQLAAWCKVEFWFVQTWGIPESNTS